MAHFPIQGLSLSSSISSDPPGRRTPAATPRAAIEGLPVEILAIVFEHVWRLVAPHPRLDIESWPWYRAAHPSLIAISHVCRVWREIALALPTLWSRVDDRIGPRLLAFLDRSRTAPLFLSICLSIHHSGIPTASIHRLLHASGTRLRRLDVRLEALDIFSHARLDFHAPCLEVLTIQCEIYAGVHIVAYPVIFRGQTAALKALALLHVRSWVPGNYFPNLTHLNISYFFMEEIPIASLAHLLSNCPRLEYLHLGQIWSYPLLSLDLTPPPALVRLPFLRNLSASCATLQTMAALLSFLVLTSPIRIRIHAATVQLHTNIWDNVLPSLPFMGPLARLKVAANSTRVFLLAESDATPSALWLQAEFEGARAHDWLMALGSTLDLAAVSSLDIACADWSLLPALVARMPALASLCVTALPDNEHTHGALLPELDAALLAPGAAPGLLALTVQCPAHVEFARRVAALAVRRARVGFRIRHLVYDDVCASAPAPAPVSDVDMRQWESVRNVLEVARAHVGALDVGRGEACTWTEPAGWDVPNPYWRLPEGDEPRAVFPWRSP